MKTLGDMNPDHVVFTAQMSTRSKGLQRTMKGASEIDHKSHP